MADRNKIIYLWDDPPFREFFDHDLNPGIDPAKIKASDKITQLRYYDKNGQICTVTPFNLSHRKGFFGFHGKRKITCKFCKDVPGFMEWFEKYKQYNPDIDINVLKTSDRQTKLFYEEGGELRSITPVNLIRRKNIFSTQRKPKYCAENGDFNKWFEPNKDINPEIDSGKISITDPYSYCYYRTKDGLISKIHPKSLFKKDGSFSPPLSDRTSCWSDPRFREWFQCFKELNPDIDPTTLYYSDTATKLYYQPRNTEVICSITPNALYSKKDWYKACPAAMKKAGKAADVPGFIELYERNRDLNEELNIDNLSIYSIKQILYRSRNGVIRSDSVHNICRRKNIYYERNESVRCIEIPGFEEWFDAYRWLNPDIDPHSLTTTMTNVSLKYLYNGKIKTISPRNLCMRRDLLSQISRCIRGDPLFWEYCTLGDRRNVDSYDKNTRNVSFMMCCPNGHEFRQSPGLFYYYSNMGRDPCPYCDGRTQLIPGVNDAASVDPEIKLFYSEDNDRPVHMVGAYNAHSNFKFKCPYCGNKFTKRMKNIVGKHPKCPKCKDKGLDVPQDKDYMPEGIPYLLVQDDPKSK